MYALQMSREIASNATFVVGILKFARLLFHSCADLPSDFVDSNDSPQLREFLGGKIWVEKCNKPGCFLPEGCNEGINIPCGRRKEHF